MFKIILKVPKIPLLFLVGFIQNSPFFVAMKIRNYCYKFLVKKMGKNCNICDSVTIRNSKNLTLGNRVSIHPYTMIAAIGEITIGDNVGIASHCSIIAVGHEHSDIDKPIKEQEINSDPIVIGNDVMIGTHASVLGKSVIGDGSFISAGSVVAGNIPPYSIVVGNPGRIVANRKKRFEAKTDKS